MKKWMMKAFVSVFALAMFAGCFSGCAAREDTLKIYNWGEYIDPGVIAEFKDWYAEETGKKIKVIYREFGANEDIWTSVSNGDDWDVVCPSDYMIDRMIQNKMLQPLDASVMTEFDKVGNPLIKDLMKTIDSENKYCVPYIWGTFGIMYDTERVTATQAEKLHSWGALWDPEFSGKIYMKEQVRDSYTVAMLKHYSAELKEASEDYMNYETEEYRTLLDNIFQKFNTEELRKAKTELLTQKPLLKKYEGDDGKMEMAGGSKNSGSLGMFWSCDAGFAMNDIEEAASFFSCDGTPNIIPGNKNLGYIVPDEGTNLWVDGWVIPTTAKNTAAANMFIKFTLRDEIATLNSEYAGAPSANHEALLKLQEEYEADDAFFADAKDPAAFKAMYMEVRFPSEETLLRSAVMSDFGDMYDDFIIMFQDVISSNT